MTLASDRAIGNVEVTSGTLRVTGLAGAQALRATGGTLDLNNSGYTFTSAQLAGGAITSGTVTTSGLFDLQSGSASAVLAGSGTVSKTTAGTVTLSGSNAYSGGTQINAGVLALGNGSALGSTSGALAVNGGTLDLRGFGLAVGALSGSAGGLITSGSAGAVTFTASSASNSTFGGVIENGLGTVGLTKSGAGILTLSGSNTYSGATTISAGVLSLGNANALAGGGNVTFGGGTLQFSSSNQVDYSGRIKSSGSAAAIDTNGQSVSFASVIDNTNTGGLTKLGSGTLTLSAANTYAGTTRIGAGLLAISNASALQNSTLDMNGSDSGTVSFGQNSTLGGLTGSRNLDAGGQTLSIGNNNASTTFSGVLSNGGLTKLGSGTLTLAGSNTYSGDTNVNFGTLTVNGSLGASLVSVASAATLMGSGTIGGPVSILDGGIIAPGNSPGTLTVNDVFTLAGASILNFEFNAQDNTVGGGINDWITGVTNLTLDGVLNISGSGDWTTVANDTSWRLFNYTGTLTNNILTIGNQPTLGTGQSFKISTDTLGQVNLVIVPEPTGLLLAAAGMAGAAWLVRRRRAA
jgi:fibronectin-binding autotransporter adhesin